MAYFIPSGIQKRLLRYVLSKLGLLDTDEYKLENLDITLGRTNNVELHNVGLKTDKLAELMKLPPGIRLELARVLLLRITIQADLWNPSVAVEVNGVRIAIRVDKAPQHVASDKRKRRRSSTGGKDGIPTTEDIAKSFLAEEPPQDKRELEDALLSQSRKLQESDILSDDGSDGGTGVAMTLPSFLSNYLQGVQDRLQVSISDVDLEVKAEVDSSEAVFASTKSSEISILAHCDALGLEGFTASHGEADDQTEHRVGKRHITLQQLTVDLVSDATSFANLSQAPSIASRSPSQPRSPKLARSDDSRSDSRSTRASPLAGQSAWRRRRKSLDQTDSDLFGGSTKARRRGSLEALLRQRSAMSDSERFADASDDGFSPDNVHSATARSPVTHPSPVSSTRLGRHDLRDAQAFLDTSHYSPGEERLEVSHFEADDLTQSSVYDLPVGVDAFNFDETVGDQQLPRPAVGRGRLSATFPNVSISDTDGQMHTDSIDRPISQSQPVSGRTVAELPVRNIGIGQLAPGGDVSSNRSSSPASIGSKSSGASSGGLTESKLFTHEDAQSMYMSALSEAPPDPSQAVTMPGGWEQGIGASQTHAIEERTAKQPETPRRDPSEDEGGATPRAASPTLPDALPNPPAAARRFPEAPILRSAESPPASTLSTGRVAKRMLSVAKVDAWVPTPSQDSQVPDLDHKQQDIRLSSMYRPTPGAFSVYEASQQLDPAGSSNRSAVLSKVHDQTSESLQDTIDMSTEVTVGPVEMQLDMSVARTVYQLLTQVQEAWKQSELTEQISSKEQNRSTRASLPLFRLGIDQVTVGVLENLAMRSVEPGFASTVTGSSETGHLFQVDLHSLEVASLVNSELKIDVRKLALRVEDNPLISFDSSMNSVSSVGASQHNDIQLSYRTHVAGTELSITTLPIRLIVDVQQIDGALSCFGGLSGVLELSSSISSAGPTTPSPAKTTTSRSRGVRFAGEPEDPHTTSLTGFKINAHFRGFNFLLTGQSCGLSLETTSIKVVGRERGISTSFKQLRLAGPYFDATDTVPPLNLRLDGTRIDFLFTPEETDLTKLVSLITPSRDKYDDDDDVLLDTLLRQRQKGSLVRVSVNVFRLDLTDLGAVQQLQTLGEELAKIQNVAKYFPEDDRPGMLTMLTIRELKAKVPTDLSLGALQIDANDLRLGHVGIPPLLATSVDRISLMHGNEVQLISEVVHREVVELPMLMVRIISDEMIPTVKVKLHNLCVEYRVPTVLALMGLRDHATVEDLSASIATSVATITRQTSNLGLRRVSTQSGVGSLPQNSKTMHIEVLFRDCAVGLNPRALPSKALFLLSDARFHSKVPAGTTYSATIDLNKAYLLVLDNVADLAETLHPTSRSAAPATGSRHVLELCQSGYVSVATMSKAQVLLHSWEDLSSDRLTEVNVKNELFVMESCADSTQTLINLLGALSPPSPPNKAERYRTKVVPMEDMMASFTGRPVVEDQTTADPDDDDDDDEFDIPVDMIGSFYAPDDPEDDLMGEPIDAIPDSDDLTMLKNARASGGDERAALIDFGERCRISTSPLTFVYEDDYYGRQAGTKAMARVWDSTRNEYGIASSVKVEKSPLRVHLHDLHFIWNLFDGYDWAKTRETIEKAVYDVESKAEERRRGKRLAPDEDDDNEEVVGDFLFNSIWIEVPANKDPRELARHINRDVDDLASETGSYATTTTHTNTPTRSSAPRPRRRRLRLQRSKHRKITFELRSVSADLYTFPPDSGETQSSLDVRVGDLEIFDHVPSSTWKKFATYMKDAGERELGKPMIRLELLDVKPVEGLAASEAVLRVSVLPLRLHVDQDALDFVTRFFEFKDDSTPNVAPAGSSPFIQRIEVNTVSVKLDYKPKKVDYAGIRSGHTTEFMNFFILDDCDIVLRHCIIYGVSGFDKLHKTLNDIWMPDVKRNQLPTVLAGLAPVRPIVNVTSGVRDLVYIPLREYNKDGRIVRSVQKGAVAFARTTTSELARLGAKLAIGTQNVLQGAEDLLSPSPSGPSRRHDEVEWDDSSYPVHNSPGYAPDDSDERRATSNYADQPIGVVAGLRSAARSLERDLLTARDAIVAIPGEVMESESAGGAVGVVARRAPTVILRTARGASKAVGVALLGAGNALDPESRRKVEEKYKRY